MDIAKEVIAAEKRIRPYIRETILEYSRYYSRLAEANVHFKLENLQHTGSFKLRGAMNKMLSLNRAQLERAFFALEHADCVLGPGHAGRYYLVGLVTPTPALFAGMPWGTGAVLGRTLAVAHRERLRVALLPTGAA